MATVQAKEEKLNIQSVTWGHLTWVNIERPTERETEYLEHNFQFHPLDLDDCLSRIQRPKIDEYKNYLFLVLHFPVFSKETRVTIPSQVSIFISENHLFTLHKGDLKPLVKLFRECDIDEESRREHFGGGSGYLLYRIIDRLVDYCLPITNKLLENIEDVEDGIFSNKTGSQIKEISVLRRDIISFRRIIWPMRAVIGGLEPKIRRFTKMDLGSYFGDTVDHLDKIWDALDEYKEIIEGLHATHDSLASNRMNDILRILTILTTIGTVLTVVVSFYGMNISLPGGANPGGGAATWRVIVIVMSAITAGMIYFFRRRHWI